MAAERKVFEIDVQTGESGKRVADVDSKLTDLRAELTKAQAALKDFKAANKGNEALIQQSATFQQLEGNLKKVRSEYGRLQNEQKGIKSNTTGLTSAISNVALKFTAGIAAVGGIASALASSVQAFGESEAAAKRLEVALGGSSAALLDQSKALSQKTKFDDDAIISAQGLLAVQKLSVEQIRQLTPAIFDLATAQGIDLETATQAVATSIVNGSDKLKKYGIDLDGAAGSSERTADAVAKLTDRFAGQAEAAAQVGTGPLQVFANNLGNLQESLGGIVVGVLNPFLSALNDIANGFITVADAVNDVLDPSKAFNEELNTQRDSVRAVYTEGSTLVTRYEELASKTNRSKEEQTELNGAMTRLSELFPGVVTGWNNVNQVVGINTEKVKENLTALVQQMRALNGQEIQQLKTALKEFQNTGVVDLPQLGLVSNASGASAKATQDVLANMESIRKGGKALNKETSAQIERLDANGNAIRETYVLVNDQFVKLVKGQNNVRELLKDPSQDFAANEQAVRNYAARTLDVESKLNARIKELNGESLAEQVANDAKVKKEKEAALANALANGTATIEQLQTARDAKINERGPKTEAPATEKQKELDAEIAGYDKRIAALNKSNDTTTSSNRTAAKTDKETYDQKIVDLQADTQKELSIINSREQAMLITEDQAQQQRLKLTADNAQKMVDLKTELSSKGGFTVDELADLSKMQVNADQALAQYDAFNQQLADRKAQAESIVKFQLDQLDIQTKLDTDLAAFDQYAAQQDALDAQSGISETERTAKQKERANERLKIQSEGNAALLNGQLEFVQAQIRVIQTIIASGQPLNEAQQKELDGLLAKATALKVQVKQAMDAATTTDEPTKPSFLSGLFNITEEQAKLLADKAIGLATDIANSVVAIQRQAAQQQLEDATNSANSQYQVGLDALKSQQEAGLLTNAEFEVRREALETKKNAKILAAKQKAFKQNQKAALAEIAINTAVAVTSALRSGVTPFDRIAGVAFAVAEGTLQAVMVKQQQPPQFRMGGQLPGDVLRGPSHEQGGVPVFGQGGNLIAEAEGGEFISSRATTSRFLPVLQAMNNVGNSGSRTARVAAFEGTTESRSALNKQSPTEIRAFVVESDITTSQKRISRMQQRAEIGE